MKKKKEDHWIALYDSNGEEFLVLDSALAFAENDQEQRKKIEGLEEDMVKGTPAIEARKMLMAAFREQARSMAVFGKDVSFETVMAAALAASHREPDPMKKEDAANAAVLALVGNDLAPFVHVPHLDASWALEFSRKTGLNLDATNLIEQIDNSTIAAIENVKTIAELLTNSAFSAARVTTIIRTETAKAVMAAKLAEMRTSKKKWVCSPGACVYCQAVEGDTLELTALFNTQSAFGRVQHPPAHPNCRCSIEEVESQP